MQYLLNPKGKGGGRGGLMRKLLPVASKAGRKEMIGNVGRGVGIAGGFFGNKIVRAALRTVVGVDKWGNEMARMAFDYLAPPLVTQTLAHFGPFGKKGLKSMIAAGAWTETAATVAQDHLIPRLPEQIRADYGLNGELGTTYVRPVGAAADSELPVAIGDYHATDFGGDGAPDFMDTEALGVAPDYDLPGQYEDNGLGLYEPEMAFQ